MIKKKSNLSVWQTHTVGVDGIRSFGGNDIITFDKFGAIRKLGVIDGQLLTIQSHDVNELIYALDVAESGPICVSQSSGIVLLSRGDLTRKLRSIETGSNPFTNVVIGLILN